MWMLTIHNTAHNSGSLTTFVMICLRWRRELQSQSPRSKARAILDRSNTWIVSLIPTRSMDVCPNPSVLLCTVQVEVLRWADPPSKKSYQMSKRINNFRRYFWIGTSQMILSVKAEEDVIPGPGCDKVTDQNGLVRGSSTVSLRALWYHRKGFWVSARILK